MNYQRTTDPPKLPPVATALLVLGVFLNFLFPLLPPTRALVRVGGRAMAFSALAVGGFLILRHYWVYDKPLFKRKIVLLAVGVVMSICLYFIINQYTGAPTQAVHY
ncbi:hypothetical protein [Hymenobacter siberiensis]|jgi:hypothetical protein|uniref:hypothetical protein n=1 Tax=Hymenobacter siberiensis TaxID=2848396 RepID=UPI001C1DFDC7|nr:hypothetical protein [Hymenobacter siberiensis]